jgi:hypothetical protein
MGVDVNGNCIQSNSGGVNMNGNGCYHQNQWVLTPNAALSLLLAGCYISKQQSLLQAIKAMDLPAFFNAFFSHPDVTPFMANGTPADWDRDWEYYNQFFAELSQRMEVLIPYENTNAYITYNDQQAPKLQFHNLPDLQQIISNRSKGSILLMHIGVFSHHDDDMGHSCLLVWDVEDGGQWFVDPCGYLEDAGVSQRMSYTSLVEGFTPFSIMSAFPLGTVQYVLEHEGAAFKGTCGISCIIIAIIVVYFGY